MSGVKRIVAVSDVHGAIDAMTQTLRNAGVVDDALAWAGGATHLVITGDILDRGADSRKVMDLIMRLEEEAPASGGRVHLLLGNHEIMNLVGDLRYVSKGEYAAFAIDETEAERERWFDVFRASRTETADEDTLRIEYDNRYPPGFFGLRRAFGTQGAYGPWLMSKPLLVVINGTAFVHGGLSPLVAELGLEGVNRTLKSQVRDYVIQTEVLAEAGILDPMVDFDNHATVLESLPEDTGRPERIQRAIETMISLNSASVHDPVSPVWYRGSVGCTPLIEEDKLAPALSAIGADRVVIGHTPTVTRRVLQRMDGRVIEIDTGMLNAEYGGIGSALVIEDGALTAVNEKSPGAVTPAAHPRRVGLRPGTLSADDLSQILANGELTPAATPGPGRAIFDVTYSGDSISAVFDENVRSRNVNPELAAYCLDVMLGLGMVPVTVARKIGGKKGSLQFVPGSMQNDLERHTNRLGGTAWCPITEQWEAMYVFDALIYNEGRSQQNMLYSIDNWQLILTGHRNAFSTRRGVPPYVENMETQSGKTIRIGSGWREALSALTDGSLNDRLGDVLDKRRIKALARRRDELLNR